MKKVHDSPNQTCEHYVGALHRHAAMRMCHHSFGACFARPKRLSIWHNQRAGTALAICSAREVRGQHGAAWARIVM